MCPGCNGVKRSTPTAAKMRSNRDVEIERLYFNSCRGGIDEVGVMA
jgi:hypothetical protein